MGGLLGEAEMGCGKVVIVALPSRAISGGCDVRVSPAGPAAPWAGLAMWGCQQELPNSETTSHRPNIAPCPQRAVLALLDLLKPFQFL